MIFNRVRYDKVLRSLHRRSANMLKNMLLNEESFVRAYLEYGARIETCRRMSLELFESTFRAAHPDMPTPKPSGGLGFGASPRVTLEAPGVAWSLVEK